MSDACRETEGDLAAMIKSLRDEKYSALILDAPVLEYVTSHNAECDLFLVGEVFETLSLALAFPPAFNDSDVYAFSRSIVKLQVREKVYETIDLQIHALCPTPPAGLEGPDW